MKKPEERAEVSEEELRRAALARLGIYLVMAIFIILPFVVLFLKR